MIIKVTQDHINRGERCRCQSCPVALACIDAELAVDWVFPATTRIRLDGTRHFTLYELPEIAREFIDAFDDGRPVAPFEFELPGVEL